MSNYSEYYGQWAGNRRGTKADKKRCCESVYSDHLSHQCRKPRGHGPDGEYCTQHDPDRRKAKHDADMVQYEVDRYNRFINHLGDCLPLIRAIAEGHNDPRSLCNDWLEKHAERLTPPPETKLTLPPPPPARN